MGKKLIYELFDSEFHGKIKNKQLWEEWQYEFEAKDERNKICMICK